MKTWTVAAAKSDFTRGLLATAWIERNPMASTWCVWLKSIVATEREGQLIDAHKGSPREFKTVDAAVNAIEGIGFRVHQLAVMRVDTRRDFTTGKLVPRRVVPN